MELEREPFIKKCAIIIGNDRWGGAFLPGVNPDINAIKSFLESPAGGAWSPNSIIEITEPITRQKFVTLLAEAAEKYEYFFIYFSGHGELTRSGNPSFVLPGGQEVNLDETRSILSTRPVLMISDSCQGFPHYGQGGRLSENRRIFSAGDVTKNFLASRMFDKELRNLPPIFTYASAVTPGQFAGESNTGGYYTRNLLNACEYILETVAEKQVVGICYPHTLAAQKVDNMTHGQQKPSISGYNRTFQPPFLVIV